jgi:hypothetical protein
MSKAFKLLAKMGVITGEEEAIQPAPVVVKPAVFKQGKRASTTITVQGESLEPIRKVIEDALTRANQPGFNYYTFRKMLGGLSSISDEANKYKTAFEAAKAMGVTAKQLASSALFYLETLRHEDDDFTTEMGEAASVQVHSKMKEASELDKQIAGKKVQLDNLQRQIGEDRTIWQALQDEANLAQTKLDTTKEAYATVMGEIRVGIETDIDKIKQYLE